MNFFLMVWLTLTSVLALAQTEAPEIESLLEIVSIENGKRKVIYQKKVHFEAPNWSKDGKYLVFNMAGKLYRMPIEGGKPDLINTGFASHCTNDHGISPDGSKLVITNNHPKNGAKIYVLPVGGGEPQLVTSTAPSYWHGWSSEGQSVAYTALRNDDYDIFSISLSGGHERRLTKFKGLDDGADYSPDGKYIYFNSVRTRTMQIWRMRTDGSNPEQITFDNYNDWFPHPSPDGKWVVIMSYIDEIDPVSHPPNKNVMLRIMPTKGGEPKELVRLFGGQGTINSPSWSPDSKQFAFVSYKLQDE